MKKAIFIHLFKTGGTSVSDWLHNQYPSEGTPENPVAFAEEAVSINNKYTAHPLIRGHIFLKDAVRFADQYRLLTILRDPEAQLMSGLWHQISGNAGEREHNRLDYDGNWTAFLDRAKAFHESLESGKYGSISSWGRQAAFLTLDYEISLASALEGLRLVDAVGITERMRDTMRIFAWKLGLPAPREIPHARDSGAGTKSLPSELRHVFRDYLEVDQALYCAARERFLADMTDLEGRAERHRHSVDDYLDHCADMTSE